MKLLWKLAIPQMGIILCLCVAGFVLVHTSMDDMRAYYATYIVEEHIARVERTMNHRVQSAFTLSAFCARNPVVQEAYSVALSGDSDDEFSPQSLAAQAMLRERFAYFLDNYRELSGNSLQLHFHLSNGRSLMRLWRQRQTRLEGEWKNVAEDLSTFRPMVLDVIRTGREAKGLELGSAGLTLCSVVPVESPEGVQLGTVEVLHDFASVLSLTTEGGGSQASLYINSALLPLATELQDPQKHPRVGDFVLAAGDVDEEDISPELLAAGRQGRILQYSGPLTLAAMPVSDYQGRQVGVLVSALESDDVVILHMQEMGGIFMVMLLASVLAPFAMLLAGIRLLVIRPLTEVTAQIRNIAEDKADLTERIHCRQKDEIGDLVKWFNILAGKIHSLFTAMRGIENSLRLASAAAEKSDKAKSDFLSRMSHEIRTPLNAIIGMTAIGRNTCDMTRREYCLMRISDAAQHLLGIINDILDMSKIEADKFELSPAECNLEKIFQRVINIVNFQVEGKQQNLFAVIDRAIPSSLLMDEQRLAQVITNLLSNAVKFTPKGGSITLTAKKVREEDDCTTLSIMVKDSGIGITEEQQKRLFTPFEQADGSVSRRFGGTGLGLAISKKIIELMDGRIWIESESGQGAAFVFEIRVRNGRKSETSAALWPNRRALVVSDAPEIRELLVSLMTAQGMLCETAENGEEALSHLDREPGTPFDLMFVDSRLPEGDGIRLTQKIAARDGKNPANILLASSSRPASPEEARSAGVCRFLQKPVLPSALTECIHECLVPAAEADRCEAPSSDQGIFAEKRILLADDVEVNREILLALIEHTGVRVDFACDGQEAVAMYCARPDAYDLILMDVQMPNMDGYEATRRIRASGLPGAETIPVIVLTANVFREDIEASLRCGANDHLGKPVDVEKLFEALRFYLLRESAEISREEETTPAGSAESKDA